LEAWRSKFRLFHYGTLAANLTFTTACTTVKPWFDIVDAAQRGSVNNRSLIELHLTTFVVRRFICLIFMLRQRAINWSVWRHRQFAIDRSILLLGTQMLYHLSGTVHGTFCRTSFSLLTYIYDRHCGTFIWPAFVISQSVLACCFLLLLFTSISRRVLLQWAYNTAVIAYYYHRDTLHYTSTSLASTQHHCSASGLASHTKPASRTIYINAVHLSVIPTAMLRYCVTQCDSIFSCFLSVLQSNPHNPQV